MKGAPGISDSAMAPGNTTASAAAPHLYPIILSNGWRGLVLTSGPRQTQPGVEPSFSRQLPSIEGWRLPLEQLASDPAGLPGYNVLKYSHGTEVFRARLEREAGAIEIVGKRSTADGRIQRWLQPLRRSRERRNFERGLRLVAAGIRTAMPLAVIERRSPRRESWLVTEFVEGLMDLDRVCLRELPRAQTERRRAVKDAIIDAVADLFVRLERNGMYHRDLKGSNILLTNWDFADVTVGAWLIDLDGLRRRIGGRRRSRQPLMRLAASVMPYASITRTDYMRFLRRYMQMTQSDDAGWQSEFRTLSLSASTYRRRSAARKSDKLDGHSGDSVG